MNVPIVIKQEVIIIFFGTKKCITHNMVLSEGMSAYNKFPSEFKQLTVNS